MPPGLYQPQYTIDQLRNFAAAITDISPREKEAFFTALERNALAMQALQGRIRQVNLIELPTILAARIRDGINPNLSELQEFEGYFNRCLRNELPDLPKCVNRITKISLKIGPQPAMQSQGIKILQSVLNAADSCLTQAKITIFGNSKKEFYDNTLIGISFVANESTLTSLIIESDNSSQIFSAVFLYVLKTAVEKAPYLTSLEIGSLHFDDQPLADKIKKEIAEILDKRCRVFAKDGEQKDVGHEAKKARLASSDTKQDKSSAAGAADVVAPVVSPSTAPVMGPAKVASAMPSGVVPVARLVNVASLNSPGITSTAVREDNAVSAASLSIAPVAESTAVARMDGIAKG
jgi:hypothetical protein